MLKFTLMYLINLQDSSESVPGDSEEGVAAKIIARINSKSFQIATASGSVTPTYVVHLQTPLQYEAINRICEAQRENLSDRSQAAKDRGLNTKAHLIKSETCVRFDAFHERFEIYWNDKSEGK